MDARQTPAPAARREKRQNVVLLVLATVLGVWLGTGAPSVSPVAPAAPPGVTVPAPAGR